MRVDDFFLNCSSPIFFVSSISLYFFPYLIKYYNMFLLCLSLLYFDEVGIGRGTYFFNSFHTNYTSLLIVFVFCISYLIFAVPMRERLGKHTCMSSPLPIAILNGTFFLRETTRLKWSKSRLSKTNYNINSIMFCCGDWAIIFAMIFLYDCPKSIHSRYGYRWETNNK